MSKRPGTSALDNLKAQRLSAGLSQDQLGKKANVGAVLINTIENGGSVETPVAQRLCDALGISLATCGQRVF